MTTPAEPQVNSATPEIVAPDAPDRGAQDDAYFESLIDNYTDEDDTPDVVDSPEPETPPEVVASNTPVAIPESPPVTPPPDLAAPAPINETEMLRQQNQQYQLQLQQQALEAQNLQLERETQQQALELEQQGVLPEQAVRIANDQRKLREQNIQFQQRLADQRAESDAKMETALQFGNQFGINPSVLMQFDTPQAMYSHASTQSELAKLRDQVANVQRGSVPAQTMDTNQPAGASGGSEIRLVDSALNKTPNERTQAENDAMRRMAGM